MSPLGNGVSIIRVCMALQFDEMKNNVYNGEAKCLLNKLHMEEKELHYYDDAVKLSMRDSEEAFRRQVLGRYLSNVATTFLQYSDYVRYGNLESIRVPFVEEAVAEFRNVVKDERKVFAATSAATIANQMKYNPKSKEHHHHNLDSNTKKKNGFILATILLSIKGDHTSVTLPFGIVRKRDIKRALLRIASDVQVEDCLIGSKILCVPNKSIMEISNENAGDVDYNVLLSERDVLKAFPDLIPLT
jgi:hypothetical protein